jgi:hypothetical protein
MTLLRLAFGGIKFVGKFAASEFCPMRGPALSNDFDVYINVADQNVGQ